jgi:Tol biopolymer transport system component
MLLTLLYASAIASTPIEVAAIDGANLQRPQWSPNGEYLSYEANHHEQRYIDLFVGSPFYGGFNQVNPPTHTSSLSSGFATQRKASVVHELSWAPDSTQFCYSATNENGDSDIFLSSGVLLVGSAQTDDSPAWSPKGNDILFTSGRSGLGDLYISDLAGTARPLPSNPYGSELSPGWAPDGRSYVWVSHGKHGDEIVFATRENSTPTPLVAFKGDQIRPTFSPDGQWIAFYTSAPNQTSFNLVVADNSRRSKAITVAKNVRVNNDGPVWTPDSAQLLAVMRDEDNYDPVIIVSRLGTDQRVLETGTVNNRDIALTARDNALNLAIIAQGLRHDRTRDFMRLFLIEISNAIQ